MPGPAPSPNARRPNRTRGGAQRDWRVLPAAGRSGAPPAFPYGRMSRALQELWSELWSAPQAVAWEELGWTRVVGRYARMVLAAEKSDAPVSLMGEVRQLEDRLGLNPMAMRKLLWRVDAVEPTVEGNAGPGSVTKLDEYRNLYDD